MAPASVLTDGCDKQIDPSGNKSFSLSGGTIPANGSCYF